MSLWSLLLSNTSPPQKLQNVPWGLLLSNTHAPTLYGVKVNKIVLILWNTSRKMTIVASVIEHIPEELITKILLPNWPEYYSNHLNYHQFVPKLDVGGYLVVIMENIYISCQVMMSFKGWIIQLVTMNSMLKVYKFHQANLCHLFLFFFFSVGYV